MYVIKLVRNPQKKNTQSPTAGGRMANDDGNNDSHETIPILDRKMSLRNTNDGTFSVAQIEPAWLPYRIQTFTFQTGYAR